MHQHMHGGANDPYQPCSSSQPKRHGGSHDPIDSHQSNNNMDIPIVNSPEPTYSNQPMNVPTVPSIAPAMFQSQPPQTAPMMYSNAQPNPTNYAQQPVYGAYPSQPNPVGQEGIMGKPVIASNNAALSTSQLSLPPSPQHEPKEFPVNLKDFWHVFSSTRTDFRWIYTHFIQLPREKYISTQLFRHRDFAGRMKESTYEDRYLHHHDGNLRKLIVACNDDVFESTQGSSTWRRTYIRKVSPMTVRLATWVLDFSYEPTSNSWEDWWVMLLRLFPAALAMQCFFWQGENERWDFQGCYAPVPYRFWGDAKVWSNHLENKRATSLLARNNDVYRVLKPRHLCFLRQPLDDELHGMNVRLVTEWEQTDGQNSDLSYLFIAYSSEQFDHDSIDDMNQLHHIAEVAARQAKAAAYWVAGNCMRNPDELESDVFRIADVLRGAKGMIIALGQPKDKTGSVNQASTDALLEKWGSRMWTFPEVLLSPGLQIPIYTRGGNLRSPLVLSKNQIASRVWKDIDAIDSQQLLGHYLGNLELSRLELAVEALKCLYSRDTTKKFEGDQAYALMGLLRLRPQIDQTDSAFQAFARLSLANDSDKLLERYLCTLPVKQGQAWHDMTDGYESSLWDIDPCCQVAAICNNDSIILDGAHGASIRWKSFFHVGCTTGPSWKRWFALRIMENMTFLLIIALIFFVVGGPSFIVGLIFLAGYLYIFLNSPRLIRTVYGGKFTEIQAALFGFEGHLNAPTVERAIFGGNFGRMSWSTNGSTLSRSIIKDGERIAVDPFQDPIVREKIERAKQAKPGQMRVFTLVDTYNMQMTLFEAVRPPTCLFLCGSEGGMQRAVACSYDWTTQTMYRETVLRMPTESLNRMMRVPRFRMGIQRPDMLSSTSLDVGV